MTDELATSIQASIASSAGFVGYSFDEIPTDENYPKDAPVKNITEVYYPSKSLHMRVEGYTSPDGTRTKHGTELVFHENGNIKKETTYHHNKKFGDCKTYYSDGVLESHYRYFNDKVGGQSYNFYPSGILKTHAYWSDGLFHGPLIIYWPDGVSIQFETNYEHGKRHGFERLFYESGKINYTAFWNNNLQDGVETRYNEKGFIIMKIYWKMGIISAKKVCHTKKLTVDEIRAKALAAKKK